MVAIIVIYIQYVTYLILNGAKSARNFAADSPLSKPIRSRVEFASTPPTSSKSF